MKLKKHTIFIAILLVIFVVQCIIAINKDSITCDEPAHMTMAYVVTNNIEIGERHAWESPNLPHRIIGMTVKILNLKLNIPEEAFKAPDIGQFRLGQILIFSKYSITNTIIFMARFSIVLVGALLFLITYFFAKELFGKKAALLCMILFAFEPNLLAHSHLITTDIVITTFFVATIYFLYRTLKEPTYLNIILTGLCLGFALSSKHSAIILIPIMVLTTIICLALKKEFNFDYRTEKLNKLKNKKTTFFFAFLIALIILSVFAIWISFGFNGIGKSSIEDLKPVSQKFNMINFNPINTIKIPLPEHYLIGLDEAFKHGEASLDDSKMYFFGRETSYPTEYFLMNFLVKTHIVLLLLLIAGIVLLFMKKLENRNDILLFILLPFVVIFLFNTFFNHAILGLRYILPVYPFLIIFAGVVFSAYEFKGNMKWILVAGFAWFILSSLMLGANYLTYFNEFVGGPYNGYKYTSDSNIDWGQDVLRFRDYLEAHPNEAADLKFTYWGNEIPQLRGINLERGDCNMTSGHLALSINYLYGITMGEPKDCFMRLRGVEPDVKVTPSIFIYDMSKVGK